MIHYSIDDIRKEFIELYLSEAFVTSGDTKTIEIIDANFEIKPGETAIFGSLNEYANRELQWYLSESLSVDDIPGECPKIWKQCATKDDAHEINSNYGFLEFNESNYSQYKHALNELIKDPNSRRACHIYTRPSIWYEYNRDGMSDYICTFATQQFLRKFDSKSNKYTLIYCVSMRSNDAITGLKNDLYWARYIAGRMIYDLKAAGIEVEDEPIIYWHANSLHLYERSFGLLENYIRDHGTKEMKKRLDSIQSERFFNNSLNNSKF